MCIKFSVNISLIQEYSETQTLNNARIVWNSHSLKSEDVRVLQHIEKTKVLMTCLNQFGINYWILIMLYTLI